MSYAGITKGTQAIGAAMMLAAMRAGSADDLLAELQSSQKQLFPWLKRQLEQMPPKAYRWVAEMQEIAGFVADDPGARDLYEGAAHFYERFAEISRAATRRPPLRSKRFWGKARPDTRQSGTGEAPPRVAPALGADSALSRRICRGRSPPQPANWGCRAARGIPRHNR